MSGGDILALCLASFSLGMFTNLLLYYVIVHRGREKSDEVEEEADPDRRGCDNCKHQNVPCRDLPCRDCDPNYPDKWEAKR